MKPLFWKMTAVLIFICLSKGEAAPKEIVATIDSIVGKAEIQKTGQHQWRPVGLGAKLHSNDVIRALDSSFVAITWPDGNASYIHANTQILFTFYDPSQPDIISTHITVLYGAIFFVIKEILPKAMTKTYDTKIYTPTGVVSVRGTGFCVEVNKKNGTTEVEVINGTVLVRNIIKDGSSFVSAGFKTKVEMNTDPIVATSILDKDLAILKSWVPGFVVDKEMASQLARAQRDHDVLAGDFKDKVVIIPFGNKSKYKGNWNIGNGFAQQIAEQLGQSNKSVIVAQTDSTAIDPLKLGHKNEARFVIAGDIEDFDIVQHAEITAAADEYKEYYIAKVKMTVQLISISDNKMLFESSFSGETRGKNVKENSWSKIGKLTFNVKDPLYAGTILGSSTQQAIDQAAEKIVQTINSTQ